MAEYNSIMNDRLFKLIEVLPDEQRKKDQNLFFGSIHRTLDHILFGDMAWLLRFK